MPGCLMAKGGNSMSRDEGGFELLSINTRPLLIKPMASHLCNTQLSVLIRMTLVDEILYIVKICPFEGFFFAVHT